MIRPARFSAACAVAALLVCNAALAQVAAIERQSLTAAELGTPATANGLLERAQ